MQKYIFFLTFFLGGIISLFAQVPQAVNYQGIARDNNGKELSNQTITVAIKIFEKESTVLYTENHRVSTNQFGLFTLQIGTGIISDESNFKNITWSNGKPKFITTSIDFNNDGQIDLQNETQLFTVPYAFHALSAETLVHPHTTILPDGSIYLKNPTQGIYLTAPNGSCYFLTVDNNGQLQTVQKTCP